MVLVLFFYDTFITNRFEIKGFLQCYVIIFLLFEIGTKLFVQLCTENEQP